MSTITAAIRDRLLSDLNEARIACRSGDRERCWAMLEDAHVLSQPWATWHVKVHGSMLTAGLGQRDWREAWGQLVRLVVAGPDSATRRYFGRQHQSRARLRDTADADP